MRAPRDLKPRPLSVSLARLSSAVAICATILAARGATLSWDADGIGGNNAASGAGLGGSGIWNNLAPAKWWAGGSTDSIWNNATADTAVFAGLPGTVDLGVPITAGNVIFNSTDYVLKGNSLTLAAGGVINLHDRSGGAINATITSQLAGNGIRLNGNGGTLTLDYAGLTPLETGEINVRSGILRVRSTQTALQNTTPLTFSGSGTLLVDNVPDDGVPPGASTYVLGALTFAGGDGVVQVERTAPQNMQLSFASLGARSEGSTGLFLASVNSGVDGANDFASLNSNARVSVGGLSTGFLQGAFAKSENTFTGFAFNDAGAFVRPLVYDGADPGALTISGTAQQFTTDSHMRVNSTLGNQSARTIRSLLINGAFTIPLNGLLTVATGGSGAGPNDVGTLLKVGGGSSSIVGTGITAGTAVLTRELIIRPDAANDTLTITAPITATTGAVTKSGDGTLILGGTAGTTANAFTGTTYVNGGRLTVNGLSAAGAGSSIVLNGGIYDLRGHGANNNNTAETITTSKSIVVNGSGTLAVGRLLPLTDAAANKTIAFTNLTVGNQVFTADPAVYPAGANPPFAGNFFLSFTGTTTFTDTLPSTLNVTGTQAAGTTAALTLGGVVSSTSPVGLIKRGTGTLALGNAGNTFGGAGAIVELQEGVLSIASDGALGSTLNTLLLNGSDPTDELLTTASIATNRSIVLGQVSNAINVFNAGNTLTLNGLVTSNITADLVKRGAGRLVLSNTGNTFGGAAGSIIDVQGGVLETASSGALGSAANTVQLNSGSFSATETVIMPQSLLLGQAANAIAVSPTKTLTINGLISSTGTVASLTKTLGGNLTLTNEGNSFGGVGSTLDIQGGGTLEVTSGGALGDPANAVKLSGAFIANGNSTASQSFILAQGAAATATITVPSAAQTFTLAGVISNDGANTVNLTKAGPGTLELTNVNTFGGTGRIITVSGGTLSAETDPSLGNVANAVTINGGGFRAIGSFTTARTFTLGGASSNIDVSQGNTLTFTQAFALPVATNALVKDDLGTLAISASQPTWTGKITINKGAIRVETPTYSTQLGTTAGVTEINNVGGLELGGGNNITPSVINEPLTINTPGPNTTMAGSNFAGVLRGVNLGSFPQYSGAITVNGAVDDNSTRSIVIGADSGTTFSLLPASSIAFNNGVGGTGRAMNLILSGESTNLNVLASTLTRTTGTLNLIKSGSGTWGLNFSTAPQLDSLTVRSGVLQSNANAAGALPAAITLRFTGTSTFRHDNVGAPVGTLNKSLGALTFTAGDGIVRNERSVNQNSFLTFASLSLRAAGATGLFLVSGNNSSFDVNARIGLTAGATANSFLGSGYFAQANAAASGFAWYDSAGFVRTVNYASDANALAISSGTLTADRYMQTSGIAAITLPTAATTVRSLHLSGTNPLNIGTGQTLTVTSGSAGGILKTGGTGSINGPGNLSAGVGNELVIRTELLGDALTISAPISNTGALTKSGLGTLTLSGSNSYSGNTYINGGTLLVQGTAALSGSAALDLSGGTFSFQNDGDGTANLQTFATGKNVTVDGANSAITVGRISAPQALNKTVTFGNLAIANQVLTITPGFGYGVRFESGTTFTEALPANFNVIGSQPSNVIPGLTLNGVVASSSGVGLIKSGVGTLLLGNNSTTTPNTFGSVGALIDIRGGAVAAGSDEALGNLANIVALNADNASLGFRATGTFDTDRIFSLNRSQNAIEVTQGNLLTLNTGLNLGGTTANTNALNKNNNGVLELGGNSPATWTGAITINAGALRLKTSAGLGGTTRVGPVVTISNPSAALQLSGTGVVYNAYPITLASSGLNSGGALENVSGNNLFTGPITLSQAAGATIGSSSGTLRLSGGISAPALATGTLVLAGAGNISIITNPLTATVGPVVKIGSGTATVGVASTAWNGSLRVDAGTFAVAGPGAKLGTTGLIQVNPGATLTINDTGTPVVNRLNARPISLTGGSLNLIGSGTGNTSETLTPSTLLNRGLTTITVTAGAGRQAVLNFNGAVNSVAPAQNANPTGASVLFRGTNLGSALTVGTNPAVPIPNVAQIISSSGGFAFNGQTGGANTTNKAILPWALVDTDTVNGEGTAFATADSGTSGIRALRPTEQSTILTANANLSVNSELAVAANSTFNSATLNSTGGRLSMTGLTQLTLSSGGILAKPGNAGITGGAIIAAAGSSPLNIWTPGAATSLTITSTLTGGNGATSAGLIKAGAGLLTLTAPPSTALAGLNLSGNSFNAMTVINQGTLRLASGNNTLFANSFLEIGPGGTLDLAGHFQHVQTLLSDGVVAGAGGVVTSSTGAATLVTNYDNAARNWAGSIQGNISFSRSGQNTATFYSDQTYTGITQINGGTTLLRDAAALSGTTAIAINYATLSADNDAGTINLPNRLNDAATITLRGGTLTLQGRAQTESSETIGAVTVGEGFNILNPLLSAATVTGPNINSMEVSAVSLARPAGSAATLIIQGTNLGTIGSSSRVQVGTLNGVSTATFGGGLTNNLVGGWAVSSTNEFLTYIPTLGFAPLNQPGAPGYDLTTIPVGNNSTKNVRLAATTAIPNGGATLNSLSFGGQAFNVTFDTAADTLNLTSGGLVGPNTTQSIGGTLDSGRLTAGGLTPGATSDLYVFNRGGTLTLNSRIVNNGASRVRAVFTALGGTIALPNNLNSYTGGTVVNGGTLSLNAATGASIPLASVPAEGLILNGATVATNRAGLIDPGNVVTLNGASTLTLTGNNVLAGLTFHNSGGAGTPTVNSGGVLSLAPGSTVTATSTNLGTVALVTGRFNLPTGQTTFAIDRVEFNGLEVAPSVASLALQGIVSGPGGIDKTGTGVLQFNAQSLFTGPVNVQGGGIQFGVGNGGSRFANVNLASAGTRINLNGFSSNIGSLSGVAGSVVTNLSATGGTLTAGFDNTNTTFGGRFARFGDGAPNTVSFSKIGTGALTLTNANNDATGTLSVQGGSVIYSGSAASAFSANNVLSTATLTLDNATANVPNRLGGAGNNAITLTVSGGTVRVIGNSLADTLETIDTFTVSNGGGILDLQANAGRQLAFNVTTAFTGVIAGGTLLIQRLAADPGAGLSTISIGSLAFNAPAGFGVDSTTLAIRPDLIGDLGNGLGTSFVTKDLVTERLRLLDPATEVIQTLTSGALSPTNYRLASSFTIAENTNSYSVVLANNAGIVRPNLTSTGQYGPNGSLLTQTVLSGGVLALAGGTSTINIGLLTTGTNVPLTFHANGNLNVTANVGAGTGGLTKSGAGIMTLTGRGFYTGVTTVNEGSLLLNGGVENSIAVVPTSTTASTSALSLNGGLVNLNGRSQAFGTLASNNANTGIGGEVTSTAAATLTSSTATSSTFSGEITGALSFVKTGNSTLTLSAPSTYTGTTTLRGGGLSLRDAGALSGTSAVELNYGTLTLDQTQLNPSGNLNPTRLPSVPVSLFGGTFIFSAGSSGDYSATINNTVSLLGGANTITSQIAGSAGSSGVLTFGNLNRVGTTATLNFPNASATGFSQRTVFTTAPTLSNNIIGPWATVAQSDFASYGANGIIGLASVAGGYSATAITAPTLLPTDNISLGANPANPLDNTVLNVLRVTGTTTISLNTGAALRLGDTGVSGGLVANAALVVGGGTAATNGSLTSGGSQLFAYINSNSTINSVITDGPGGAVSLVKSGGSALTLTAANTYTGTTVVNQGTLTLSTAGANGTSVVAIPGDLLINNATTTLTTANQIKNTANVTLDGAATLTTGGSGPVSNTIGRLTFNNRGGNSNPTVATSSILNLTAGGVATPTISSTNDVLSTTPVISGTSLSLTNADPVITTAGLAPTSLLITAPIHTAGVGLTPNPIIKTGSGAVAFAPSIGLSADATGGSQVLSGLLSTEGLAPGMSVTSSFTITINNVTLPLFAPGTLIQQVLQGGTSLLLSAPTNFPPNIIIGGVTTTFSGSTFKGGFTLNGGSLTLASSSVLDTNLINTPIVNGPVGTGTLTLADGAAVTSDGTIRTLHNAVTVLANFAFGLTESSGATSLAGNGVILAGPVTLSPGSHSIAVNGPLNISTISGLITGSGGSLTKTGSGTLVLSQPGNSWGGDLFVNGGVLRSTAANAIPSGINLTVASGAVFDMPGITQTLNTLSGGGVISNSSVVLDSTLSVSSGDFSGTISGIVGSNPAPASLGLTKEGTGTLILRGTNSYRGQTNVNAGRLQVAVGGSLKIANDFNVNDGGIGQIDGLITADSGNVQTSGLGSVIRGSGTLLANTNIRNGGILEPLRSGGTNLTIQNSVLEMFFGSTLLYTADGFAENRVTITGDFSDVLLPTGGWTLRLTFDLNFNPTGKTFVLFDGDNNGTLLNGNTFGGQELVGNPTIVYGTTGWSGGQVRFDELANDIILTGVVPEPGTASLLLGSFAMALGLQRFRRRQH